jgi:hypothetical protein
MVGSWALSTVLHARRVPLAAVRGASTAIYDAAIRTPLIRSDIDPSPAPRELYLELELLQPIGSFDAARLDA